MRRLHYLAIVGVMLVLATGMVGVAQQATKVQPTFGGKYRDLKPDQEKLVADWFQRFSQVVNHAVTPEEGYDNLPLSVRTTFEAVTHALLRTPLTDELGASLAESSLSIVEKVDSVAGRRTGARGDKQFRIYVQLVPGVFSLLAKSKEFIRERDNTMYHKGYPVCYRSVGGAPSIQVSATRDGKLGDIDVDYRSSTFPVFLVNGHLSASNSDVMAGDNDQRHNQRWSGLTNWWRTLLGLPWLEDRPPLQEAEKEIIPSRPRIKPNSKPADSVHDFLQSWLVEQKPEEAIAYIDQSAIPCMELETGQPVDRGMAKFIMLGALQGINKRVGRISDLSEVSTGVRLSGDRSRVIRQPYQGQFVLYDVREDLAELLKCGNQLDSAIISPKAAQSHKFGKYVGAVFRLHAGETSGQTIATLWDKHDKYWKLISYDVDPDFAALSTAAAAPLAKAPMLARVSGDKDMIRAAERFYKEWFLRKDIEKAFQYVSPQSYACSNLYRSGDTLEPKSQEEEAKLVRTGMERMTNAVGRVNKLTHAILAPEASHPDIRLVGHPSHKAFVIASVPDQMASAATCSSRKVGEVPSFDPSAGVTYNGNYYATGIRLATEIEDSSVLWTVWSKVDGQWKITSYAVITP